jgi:hypothetical protein
MPKAGHEVYDTLVAKRNSEKSRLKTGYNVRTHHVVPQKEWIAARKADIPQLAGRRLSNFRPRRERLGV